MNILFISEYYPPKVLGGGEINLASIAQGLAGKGQNVMVLTSFFPGLERYEEKEKVRIYRRLKTGATPGGLFSSLQRSLLFPRSIVREVQRLVAETLPEIPIDLIHFQGTSIIAAPRLRKLNKPLFATIESYPALCPKGDRWYRGKEDCKIVCSFSKFLPCQAASREIGKIKNSWYLKYNLPLLLYIYWHYRRLNKALGHCRLIPISRYVQDLLAQHALPSGAVIPNIIEADKFSAVGKEKRGKVQKREKDQKLKILYLGALIESKGPQILLEALKGLNEQGLNEQGWNYHCDLYGDGPLKEQLQEMIVQNKLDAEIHPFVSPEQVPQLYAAADLVVYPSLWPEPFGRIPLEARAAGRKVVASKVGAIPEFVPSQNLVLPGDSHALRQALCRALQQAYRLPKPVFSLQQGCKSEHLASQLTSLYKEGFIRSP